MTYAGTKDKQAKSTQRMCFPHIEARGLLQLNEGSNFLKLGNCCYSRTHLRLGELSGNHFKIVIKGVECESPNDVDIAIKNLASNGFINYYGLQRFGTYNIATHK